MPRQRFPPELNRTYSETAFRQAAFQLDQIRAERLATLPPAEHATQYIQSGQDYLSRGLLPEAEQEFHLTLTADPKSALAHAGLAQIREQSSTAEEARTNAVHLDPKDPAAQSMKQALQFQGQSIP